MNTDLTSYNEIKSNLAKSFRDLAEICKVTGWDKKYKFLSEGEDKLRQDRFNLMVAGDFSRGKSTLINALLGAEILPARMTPCTAAINTIRYAETPGALKVYWDENRETEQLSFDQFLKEITLPETESINDNDAEVSLAVNADLNQHPVRRMELLYPVDLCKLGVDIIDSPGLNEDKRQTEITYKYLPTADAVMVVLAATKLLAENERKFIRRLIKAGAQNLFFVINFVDLIEDDDELDELKEEAEEVLTQITEEMPQIYYVSAKDALNGKIEKNMEKVEDSGFAQMESDIAMFLTQNRGSALIKNGLKSLEDSALTIEAELHERKALLQVSIDELEAKREAIKPRIENLQSNKHQIIAVVDQYREETRRRVIVDLRDMLYRLVHTDIEVAAKSWSSDVRVLVTKAQYQKCSKQILKKADAYIEDNFNEWVQAELVPYLKVQQENMLNAIGDDARDILESLNEVKIIIHPDAQVNDYSGEKPASIIERLITAGIGIAIADPFTVILGGTYGAKQAVEQFALNVSTLFVMGFLGVFSLPLFISVATIVALARVYLKNGSAKEKIRDDIIEKIQNRMRQPSGEMEDKFKETVDSIFLEWKNRLSKGIDNSIIEVQSQLDTIIAQKCDSDVKLDTESVKHNELLKQLTVIMNNIKSLTDEIDSCYCDRSPAAKGILEAA